jgi:hypothetical protein
MLAEAGTVYSHVRRMKTGDNCRRLTAEYIKHVGGVICVDQCICPVPDLGFDEFPSGSKGDINQTSFKSATSDEVDDIPRGKSALGGSKKLPSQKVSLDACAVW